MCSMIIRYQNFISGNSLLEFAPLRTFIYHVAWDIPTTYCVTPLRCDMLHAIIYRILLAWISRNIHWFIMQHIKFAIFGSMDLSTIPNILVAEISAAIYTLMLWICGLSPTSSDFYGNKTCVPHGKCFPPSMLHFPKWISATYPVATVWATMHGMIIQVLAKLWEQLFHDFFCNRTAKLKVQLKFSYEHRIPYSKWHQCHEII
jgi:hypothetical protein